MVFVLDDNVYADIVLPVVCTHHGPHSVRLVLEKADMTTAQTFLGLASRLTLRCTDVHKHPLERAAPSHFYDKPIDPMPCH